MKVIILAAGVGKRLGKSGENKPKCLIKFDGISLLRRHLQTLSNLPIDEILVITGFQKHLIDNEIQAVQTGIPVNTVYNPDFMLGSVVSFWCSRGLLCGGDDIILMDADVLYDPRLLTTLVETDHINCFLLDRNFEPGDEPVKLCVRGGKLVDFRKAIDEDLEYDYQGESVGFFRFSAEVSKRLANRAQFYIDNDRHEEPYEEVIRDVLIMDNDVFAFEDITGLPWIEIDFPEDLDRAKKQVLINMTSTTLQN